MNRHVPLRTSGYYRRVHSGTKPHESLLQYGHITLLDLRPWHSTLVTWQAGHQRYSPTRTTSLPDKHAAKARRKPKIQTTHHELSSTAHSRGPLHADSRVSPGPPPPRPTVPSSVNITDARAYRDRTRSSGSCSTKCAPAHS